MDKQALGAVHTGKHKTGQVAAEQSSSFFFFFYRTKFPFSSLLPYNSQCFPCRSRKSINKKQIQKKVIICDYSTAAYVCVSQARGGLKSLLYSSSKDTLFRRSNDSRVRPPCAQHITQMRTTDRHDTH